MASAVNNLRVNNREVKSSLFNKKQIKEIYFNNVLIWKNANPFIFTQDIKNIDLSTLGSDTLIFENFAAKMIKGSYNTIESLDEKPKEQGQMVVLKTTEGDV